MRCSHRTLITATCATLVLAVCWLIVDLTVTSNAAAQSGPPATAQTIKKGDLFEELGRSRIEAILDEPVPEIKIQQMPLREVLAELKTLTGIAMYFDPEELGDVIDPEVPTTVDVGENSITYNTLIKEFILAPNDLTFVIRHNSLVIMSYDKSLVSPDAVQLVVYNCRDLLVGIPDRRARAVPGGVSGGDGVESPEGESDAPGETTPATTENLHQFGRGKGIGTGGLGLGGLEAMPAQETFSDIGARQQQLIDLIRLIVINEDFPWDDGSSPGNELVATIKSFNGLLVIRTFPEDHEKVRRLLRLLRESAKEQAWPADLGDWPHKKRIAPPKGEEPHPAGSGYF